jgi:chromosomal replication initiator protein
MSPYIIPGIITPKNSHTMKELMTAVCEYYEVDPLDVCSQSRKGHLVIARHIFYYLTKQVTKKKLLQMGNYTGGRDHTTVIHGLATISDFIEIGDMKIITDLHNIQKKIGAVAIPLAPAPVPVKMQFVAPVRVQQFQRAEW